MLLRTAKYFRPAFRGLGARSFANRHKVVTTEDAIAVVKSGDTFMCSGFVAQGVPEHLLRALGEKFEETGEPRDLTLFFAGGPGDWDKRGLNHLGKEGMIKRTIGTHYGQTPKIADLVLQNKVQAYNIPLGCQSRILRCTASRLPGYLTEIGKGTFVDPDLGGGKLNELAEDWDIVTKVPIEGKDYLFYKKVPLDVCFIRHNS